MFGIFRGLVAVAADVVLGSPVPMGYILQPGNPVQPQLMKDSFFSS